MAKADSLMEFAVLTSPPKRRGKLAPDYAKKFLKKALQPTNSHYGGMGIAKPSVWIPMRDLYAASKKFKSIYSEHIEGFGGKSYKKSKRKMSKKEKEKPLWKKCLEAKQARDSGEAAGVTGKKKRKKKKRKRALEDTDGY
ncbi:hypothetical protein AAMO2058_001353100 [Amorphochlora amoebiformis]